jgi:hypothetical protein
MLWHSISPQLNSPSSTFSVEEIVAYTKSSSTLLESTLELLEPSQVANNETAKVTEPWRDESKVKGNSN